MPLLHASLSISDGIAFKLGTTEIAYIFNNFGRICMCVYSVCVARQQKVLCLPVVRACVVAQYQGQRGVCAMETLYVWFGRQRRVYSVYVWCVCIYVCVCVCGVCVFLFC